MVQIIKYPAREDWERVMARPDNDISELHRTVGEILADVRVRGDEAIREYGKRFDGVELSSLEVTPGEFEEAETLVSPELRFALGVASANIARFHASQVIAGNPVETTTGVTCWQKSVGIEKVGLYIPGGTAPLFSTVLMLAVPAKIAGCKEIVICTPPGNDGKIHPAILYAARIAGVTNVFKIGGTQAIGAMAYGTETVPRVYKIFGPGNRYVMAAKQLVSLKDVAIDMPAGPSEVMLIADGTADMEFLAADFLSQAEHGPDSQSILLTTDEELADSLSETIERQLGKLRRQELTRRSLSHSSIVVLKDEKEIMDFANAYAPEHLIIQCDNYGWYADKVVNAGSVFLGKYTPESAGDYASGTNHTLPTSGYAKAYSGVNLDSFSRKITFQEITEKGMVSLGPVIETMASFEQLDAHKNAVTVRLNEIISKNKKQ